MKPTLEKFEESSKVPLLKINVDTENDIAQKYGIRSIPCFVVIEDKKETARKIGMQSVDQLIDLVKYFLDLQVLQTFPIHECLLEAISKYTLHQ